MVAEFKRKILELIMMPIDTTLQITKGTTPIPFFGNLEQATACTISLNPSDREFYDAKNNLLENDRSRLCYRKKLGKKDEDKLSEDDAEKVLKECEGYFDKKPYKLWFDKMETFLRAFDANLSYYEGSVVALDLVQWATTPKWADLTDHSMSLLLQTGLPFLKELLSYKKFKFIFLNGETAFSKIQEQLKFQYIEQPVNDGKKNFSAYFGEYNQSIVVGWSIYLQSAQGGSYDNIRKIAGYILNKYSQHKTSINSRY